MSCFKYVRHTDQGDEVTQNTEPSLKSLTAVYDLQNCRTLSQTASQRFFFWQLIGKISCAMSHGKDVKIHNATQRHILLYIKS